FAGVRSFDCLGLEGGERENKIDPNCGIGVLARQNHRSTHKLSRIGRENPPTEFLSQCDDIFQPVGINPESDINTLREPCLAIAQDRLTAHDEIYGMVRLSRAWASCLR